jgi:putative ABC transport system permease protein
MFSNFLTTAYRHFMRRKQYSLLSIFVMVIGLTTALLTFLYARYEFSYENWLPDADNIYRVESNYHFPGAAPFPTGFTGRPTGPALQLYYPEVAEMSRSMQFASTIERDGEIFNDPVDWLDPNFIGFFDFEMLQGDRDTALTDVTSLIISERMAEKYFGRELALGKILSVNSVRDYRVTGVFKNLPDNTHLAIEMAALYDESVFTPFFPDTTRIDTWNMITAQTYFKLNAGTSIDLIANNIDEFTRSNYKHPSPVRAQMNPLDFVNLAVRPITDIHLYSENVNEIKPGGTIETVMGLAAIAVLILVAVVVNYVNLTTALSTLRAKEISLRKTMGADNGQIRLQFIAEAVILAMVAMMASLVVVQASLPWFGEFLNLQPETLQVFSDPLAMIAMFVISLSLGVISGAYPAFYLSQIKPAEILSSNKSGEQRTATFRSLLVTLQFSVSVGLLIAILIVTRQIDFVTSMDIGVETDNVTVVRLPTLEAGLSVPTLLNEFSDIPGVISVAASSNVPTDGAVISTGVDIPGRGDKDALSAWYVSANEGFFQTYGLDVLSGRGFSEAFPIDRRASVPEDDSDLEGTVLINETAVKFLGFENNQDVLGFRYRMNASINHSNHWWVTVVGVVPDFQFGSAYDQIQPTFFTQTEDAFFAISVKSTADTFGAVQAAITDVWNRVLPEDNLTINPMSELLDAQYDEVNRQGASLNFLGIVAVIISCLGIFGMASFMVERRTREIGLRKVLGAKVMEIVTLLLAQFSKPVVLANLVAWPIAWYLMRGWLDSFNYRIDLNATPFLLAGLISLGVAWLIVSSHAIRAARSNPIKALRYE